MKTLVTNAEIEEVGESLIRRFIGKRKPPPNCIDIEGFITDYLHLPVVYAGIAEEDRDKIGFVSDGAYPLAVWEEGERQSVVAEFVRQIKNPYCFRCGDFTIRASFASDGVTIEERLQGLIR